MLILRSLSWYLLEFHMLKTHKVISQKVNFFLKFLQLKIKINFQILKKLAPVLDTKFNEDSKFRI